MEPEMEIYTYLQNFNTKTDATISGSLHSAVKVEIERLQHGDWMTIETRHFDSVLEARQWADRRLVS
jgi:hypothetical protein